MKLTMTRFHFSISKVVSKYLTAKDNTSNFTTIFLIGVITLLLGIYSFVAYSFLETSSSFLIEDYSFLASTPTNQNKQTNQFFCLHKTAIHNNTIINNEAADVFPITTFFEKHLEHIPKGRPLCMSISMLCISEKIIEKNPFEFFQKYTNTVS